MDPFIWTLNLILLPFGVQLDSFHWGLTNILKGLGNGAIITFQISIISIFFGFFIAVLMASLLTSKSNLFGLKPLAQFYVDFFRSTPLLVQILLVYFAIPAIWQDFADWVRETGGSFEMVAGTIGLTLNTSAYQAEIVRSGINAIPSGQTEAARALGMSPAQTMIHVILPQAIRIIIPPMTNEIITLILNSSLVSAIGVLDITKRSQSLLSFYYAWWVFLVAASYYFIMSYTISKIAKMVEIKYRIPGLGTTND
jgi:His/Glu/Gln/Arg/opine family amino acid ABC transporter permease subunit